MRNDLEILKKGIIEILAIARAQDLGEITDLTIQNLARITHLQKKAPLSKKDIELILSHYSQNPPFALFMADVKGLSEINNSYGRKYGDILIRTTQEFLEYSFRAYSNSRPSDTVLRFGEKADEFLAIAESTDRRKAKIIEARLRKNMKEWIVQPLNLQLQLHLGHAIYTPDLTIEELLEQADKKMRKSKDKI